MRRLVLIKHALPNIDEGRPAKEWNLSEAGKEKSKVLAKLLQSYNSGRIYASDEPKASETGKVIGGELNLELKVQRNLHENDRTGLGFLDREQYDKLFQSFFANSSDRIVGNETALEAQTRFVEAVLKIVEQTNQEEDVVIVAHGTVISLFVSYYNDIDTFEFWKSLALPAMIELTIPDYKIINVIEKIG